MNDESRRTTQAQAAQNTLPAGYVVVATLQLKVRFTDIAASSRQEAALEVARLLRETGVSQTSNVEDIHILEAVVSDHGRTGTPTIELDGTVSAIPVSDSDPLSGRSVTFIGQAWINNQCYNVDDGRCSFPLTMSELSEALATEPAELDYFANARHAPAKVKTWPGPFIIVLDEAS